MEEAVAGDKLWKKGGKEMITSYKERKHTEPPLLQQESLE
jgi:hypothetical protein